MEKKKLLSTAQISKTFLQFYSIKQITEITRKKENISIFSYDFIKKLSNIVIITFR